MSEQMPTNVHAVYTAYAREVPPPSGGPNPADEAFENRCRAWTKGLAQQIVFSTGDRTWGCKNAGGGRPPSKDAIAHQNGATLFGYDTLFGVGTGSPSLNPNPVGEDITGQTFMPVEPVDYLGGAQPPGPGPDPGDDELEARVRALEVKVAQQQSDIDQLRSGLVGMHERLDASDEANNELRLRLGSLQAKVDHLVVRGPTKGRFALGSHYHDVDLQVQDSRQL